MYLPQSYLVHEEMMVTEKLDSTSDLGYYINYLCNDKDMYRLQRRETILGKCTQTNPLIRLCLQETVVMSLHKLKFLAQIRA